MEFFYTSYDKFLTLFPEPIQWLVSLIVIISLVVAFYVLIRFHWIFFLLLVIFVPIIIPATRSAFTDIYNAFLYIWSKVGLTIDVKKG